MFWQFSFEANFTVKLEKLFSDKELNWDIFRWMIDR